LFLSAADWVAVKQRKVQARQRHDKNQLAEEKLRDQMDAITFG
jgi:hypothetical protein